MQLLRGFLVRMRRSCISTRALNHHLCITPCAPKLCISTCASFASPLVYHPLCSGQQHVRTSCSGPQRVRTSCSRLFVSVLANADACNWSVAGATPLLPLLITRIANLCVSTCASKLADQHMCVGACASQLVHQPKQHNIVATKRA